MQIKFNIVKQQIIATNICSPTYKNDKDGVREIIVETEDITINVGGIETDDIIGMLEGNTAMDDGFINLSPKLALFFLNSFYKTGLYNKGKTQIYQLEYLIMELQKFIFYTSK